MIVKDNDGSCSVFKRVNCTKKMKILLIQSVAKNDDDDGVTCSREWVVPRILLTESFNPLPMLSASSLVKVIIMQKQQLSS